MDYDLKKIGKIISEARRNSGLTLEEVGLRVGVTKSTVQRYEKGLIKSPKRAVLESIARALALDPSELTGEKPVPNNIFPINNPNQKQAVPILGRVAAGDGAFADSNVKGYIMENKSSLSPSSEYAYLVVEGDSMYPEFKNGDMVLIQCSGTADNGSYAVVMVDDDNGVIKKVEYGDGYITLHSVNPLYPPRKFEGKDLERIRIFGTVKGLRRSF